MNTASFFFKHAGYSYPTGADKKQQRACRWAGARKLAEAQLWASQNLSFRWEVDPFSNSSEFSDSKPVWSLWLCWCIGSDGAVLSSLGGIDFGRHGEPWGDSYKAIIEAELALEQMPN